MDHCSAQPSLDTVNLGHRFQAQAAADLSSRDE
jgi:hypothetical protein